MMEDKTFTKLSEVEEEKEEEEGDIDEGEEELSDGRGC